MAFQFRFESILKLRQREKELRLQSVAMARSHHSTCVQNRDRLAAERSAILDELRQMNESDRYAVGQILDRQRHADQLGAALTAAEAIAATSEGHLEQCLQELVAANQAVQAMDKLQQRHLSEYQTAAARMAAYDS